MTIYTQERKGGVPYLWEMSASRKAVFRAHEEEALATNPVEGLKAFFGDKDPHQEILRQEGGVPAPIMPGPQTVEGMEPSEFELEREKRRYIDPTTGEAPVVVPPQKVITATDARGMATKAGVKLQIPDDGIDEDTLEALITYKVEEAERQDYMARAPSGAASLGAGFAGGLWGSAQDPVNILSGFIPFVGPAKYTQMLGKAGSALARAGVRGGVGATEGALGAVAMEPFVLYGVNHNQADYTVADSFMNIVFGTVLGGGLHMGGGAIKDLAVGPPTLPMARPSVRNSLSEVVDSLNPEVRNAELGRGVDHALAGVNTNAGNYAGRVHASRVYAEAIGPSIFEANQRVTVRSPDYRGEAVISVDPRRGDRVTITKNDGEVISVNREHITSSEAETPLKKSERVSVARKTKDGGYELREGTVVTPSKDGGATVRIDGQKGAKKYPRAQIDREAPEGYDASAILARGDESTFRPAMAGPWRPEYEALTPGSRNNLDYKRYTQEHAQENVDVYDRSNGRLNNPEASRLADENAEKPDIEQALDNLTKEEIENMEDVIRVAGMEDELEVARAEMAEADRMAKEEGDIFKAASLCPAART